MNAQPQKTASRRNRPGRWWQWLIVLLVAVGFGANYVWQKSLKPPEFYAELKELTQQQQSSHAKHFDEKIDELKQQIQSDTGEELSISFSQDEINSWLSTTLPRRFPRAMPREVKELLVKLDTDDSSLVINIDSKFFEGFATADFNLAIGKRPNLLEISLERFYSGVLSVPIARFRQRIVSGAAKSKLPVTWDEDTLPANITVDLNQILRDQLIRPAEITAVEIQNQNIQLQYQFLDD